MIPLYTYRNSCGRQNSKLTHKSNRCIISFPGKIGHHCCNYVMLRGKRDSVDVVKITTQLTLSQSNRRSSDGPNFIVVSSRINQNMQFEHERVSV